MPDLLKISLWVGLAAIAVGVVFLVAVAWANAGSRNLALAMSTLFAAILLFSTQLLFELRARSTTDFFTAEFTINRKNPEIRQWNYPVAAVQRPAWRMPRDMAANGFLVKNDPTRFNGDRARLTSDMVLFSLVSYLGSEQFDWRLRRIVFQGSTMGAVISAQRLSKPEECTAISPEQLKGALIAAGNAFANADIMLMGGQICLPPGSVLTLAPTKLEISTPYCTVTFTLEPSGSISYTKPGTGGEVPLLDNGEPELETRLVGIRTLVEFSWIRAQARQMNKYEDWSDRLVRGARLWFEPGDENDT